MKKGFFIALTLLTIILPSCKKSTDDPNNSNNNNNNNNPPTVVRTGLAALVDPKAETYFIMDYQPGYGTPRDTVMLQNTSLDSSKFYSGSSIDWTHTFHTQYLVNEFWFKSNGLFKNISFEFGQKSGRRDPSVDCSWADTLIRKGDMGSSNTVTYDHPYINVWVFPKNGVEESSTDRYTDSTYMHIESITPLTTSTGCTKVRVKGTLSTANFWNSICGPYPTYCIKNAAFQLDFQVQH